MSRSRSRDLKQRATFETEDAIQVLAGGGLHPNAVAHLESARTKTIRALNGWWGGHHRIHHAVGELREARARLILSDGGGS
jgi:hypothetical protein